MLNFDIPLLGLVTSLITICLFTWRLLQRRYDSVKINFEDAKKSLKFIYNSLDTQIITIQGAQTSVIQKWEANSVFFLNRSLEVYVDKVGSRLGSHNPSFQLVYRLSHKGKTLDSGVLTKLNEYVLNDKKVSKVITLGDVFLNFDIVIANYKR